ncbi:hypothetical protein EV424DRAFT_1542109 [Suillus variegatus]|nr:hypothetical protein EV424DRAFT_1542109 [Suillus variegatus]
MPSASPGTPSKLLLNRPPKLLLNCPPKLLLKHPPKLLLNRPPKLLLKLPLKLLLNCPPKLLLNHPPKLLLNHPPKLLLNHPPKLLLNHPPKLLLKHPPRLQKLLLKCPLHLQAFHTTLCHCHRTKQHSQDDALAQCSTLTKPPSISNMPSTSSEMPSQTPSASSGVLHSAPPSPNPQALPTRQALPHAALNSRAAHLLTELPSASITPGTPSETPSQTPSASSGVSYHLVPFSSS